MSKEILCVTDFSESSKEAIRCAVSLAQKYNDHLSVLYAYRLLKPIHGEAVEMKKEIEADAAKKFLTLEKDFLKDSGVNYDFKIEVGFLTDRVKEHLKRNNINFLVVGKKLTSSQKQSLEEVMEGVNRPLIIVP